MSELEPTAKRIIRIWWLIIWRSVVGGILLGIVGGSIAGAIAALSGHRETARLAGMITGYLLNIAWFFVVLGMALRKHYGGFRIALIPLEPSDAVKL